MNRQTHDRGLALAVQEGGFGAPDPVGVAALLGASAIWGASFVLAKLALLELDLAHVLIYRFGLAVLPLLPILVKRAAWPNRRDLWLFSATGFLMVPVTFTLQFAALELTSATSTALLVGTGAPLLGLAGVLVERERLEGRGWTAIVMSCLGVALLVGLPGEGDDWRGNLMMFVSMIICTVWVILSKRLVGRYNALHATGWILVFGTLSMIPFALAWGGPPALDVSARAWLSLLGLGLGCTSLAYVLWNWGIARVGAARAGVYLNLEPIVGALLGVAILGDLVGPGVALGGGLILSAAWMVSTARQDSATPSARWLHWWQADRPSLGAELSIRLWRGSSRRRVHNARGER